MFLLNLEDFQPPRPSLNRLGSPPIRKRQEGCFILYTLTESGRRGKSIFLMYHAESGTRGISIVNTLPFPNVLSTRIFPLCASMTVFT